MYYNRHYIITFCRDKKLLQLLENEFGIPCIFHDHVARVIFDIPENHPRMDELEQLLPKETPLKISNFTKEQISKWLLTPLNKNEVQVSISYSAVYSEEDRRTAPWLDVRSVSGKVKSPDGFRYGRQCILPGRPPHRDAVHRAQDRPFEIAPPVKWGRNSIACSEWCDRMLFCNKCAKRILTAENLNGLQFDPVHSEKTKSLVPDVFQISSSFTSPDDSFVGISHIENHVCEFCGMKMLIPQNERARYAIREGKLDQSVDIYKTLPLFLPRCGDMEPVHGTSHIIISQRFYRVLADNQMDHALEFTPLNEVL